MCIRDSRGSDHDVVDVDILETVKTGDNLTINKYPDIGLDDVFHTSKVNGSQNSSPKFNSRQGQQYGNRTAVCHGS